MSLASLVSFWTRRFVPRQRRCRPIRCERPLRVESLEQRTVPSASLLRTMLPTRFLSATPQLPTQPPSPIANPGALVTGLYYDVLNREPTKAEVNNWVSAINGSNLDGTQVAMDFLNSTEYRTKLLVNDYQQLLGRKPDGGAIDSWLTQISDNRLNAQQIMVGFLTSPEYFAKQGGGDFDWLVGVYRDLLGREPDLAGFHGWTVGMKNGLNMADVAMSFVTAPEVIKADIATAYQSILGRAPDATGLSNWTAGMLGGLSLEGLIADLVASDEYANQQDGIELPVLDDGSGNSTGTGDPSTSDGTGQTGDATGTGQTGSGNQGGANGGNAGGGDVGLGAHNGQGGGVTSGGNIGGLGGNNSGGNGGGGNAGGGGNVGGNGGNAGGGGIIGGSGGDGGGSGAGGTGGGAGGGSGGTGGQGGGTGSGGGNSGGSGQSGGTGSSGSSSSGGTVGSTGSGGATRGNALANIRVSNESGQDNVEVSLAVNPTNPLNLVTGDTPPTDTPAHTFYTVDGGKTWIQVNVGGAVDGQNGPNSFRSDYETRIDANGRVYGAYVLFGDFNTLSPSIVQVNHSTDGGKTYRGSTVFEDTTAGFVNDKEILATGPDPANPKQQNVYITWVRFDNAGNGTIMIAGSTDGGVTWSKAARVSPASRDTDPTQFGQPSVGPSGQINVSYFDLNTGEILFRSSPTFTNGNFNFGPEVVVTKVNEILQKTPIPAQPNRGIATLPRSYTDTSPDSHRGRIDIIYCDVAKGGRDPATNEYIVHSDDGGKTWSTPLKINDATNKNSAFNGDMAIDPKSGNIVAAWRDARNDPANGKIDVFASFSRDGGTTFSPNIKITDLPSSDVGSSDPNDFLEYDGVDNFNGTAYFDWSDNRANPGGLFKTIFFDTRPNGGVPVGPPIPGGGSIADDRFDPNETSDTATLFGVLRGAQQFDNLTINHHPSNGLPDYDWFRWSAGSSGTYNVVINYTAVADGADGNMTGDLNIRAFTLGINNTLVQIASSRVLGTTQQVIHVAVTAGEPLLLWVYGFQHADATYQLLDSIT